MGDASIAILITDEIIRELCDVRCIVLRAFTNICCDNYLICTIGFDNVDIARESWLRSIHFVGLPIIFHCYYTHSYFFSSVSFTEKVRY